MSIEDLKQHKCFVCGRWFIPTTWCAVCRWRRCPYCGACYCTLNVGEKRVASAMFATYRDYGVGDTEVLP